jgi:hypothetical protein
MVASIARWVAWGRRALVVSFLAGLAVGCGSVAAPRPPVVDSGPVVDAGGGGGSPPGGAGGAGGAGGGAQAADAGQDLASHDAPAGAALWDSPTALWDQALWN